MDLSHILCVVMVCIAMLKESEACMCLPQTLRQYLCKADFVVKATVSSWAEYRTEYGSIHTYTLHIQKVFKMPQNFANETELLVHSVPDGQCGINPGRDDQIRDQGMSTSYFITGNVIDDTLWSRLCNNVYRPWSLLSSRHKRKIFNLRNLTC